MGFNHLLNTNKIKSLLFSFHCDKKNYVFEISNIMPKIMTVSLYNQQTACFNSSYICPCPLAKWTWKVTLQKEKSTCLRKPDGTAYELVLEHGDYLIFNILLSSAKFIDLVTLETEYFFSWLITPQFNELREH